jgi:hypothetical protein
MNRRLKPTVLFGMLALTLCASMPSAISAPRANNGLTGHDKELYENARARGARTVMVLIASKPGANTTVVNGLNKLGAVIRYRDDALGYVRAIVGIESVTAASKLAGVQTFNLDELIEREPVRAGLEPGDEAAAVPTPPGPTTMPSNSQMPTRDTGAVQFVQDHPTYDGRGTKVAIVDSGVDILTPELQDATAADGSTVRKIIDWVNYNDPLSGEDPSWVDMATQVNVAGGQVTVDGVTYTGIGADGTYRFGIFDESLIPTSSDYYLPGGVPGRHQPRRRLHRQVRRALAHQRQPRLGRHQRRPRLHRRGRPAGLQSGVRAWPVRHRQPGDRAARERAVRDPDRRQGQVRQHRRRGQRARHARGGHRHGQQLLRRCVRRRGPWGTGRLGARVHVRDELHLARA